MEISFNRETISRAADHIIDHKKHAVIRIDGAMGAGKTTLISEICKKMGVLEATSSPTFSLVNNYQGKKEPIYHFDFYRINNLSEALDLGCEEYMDNRNYCFIEWPEKSFGIIPNNCIQISILKKNSERIFKFVV